jgi:hypothetical protein
LICEWLIVVRISSSSAKARNSRTVDTHVRHKLGKAAGTIETVRGFGYRGRFLALTPSYLSVAFGAGQAASFSNRRGDLDR